MQLELLDVMRELYNLSGFRITVHDIDFREIYAYPDEHTPYCRMMHSIKDGFARCKECDYAAFKHVKETGEAYIYRCHAGLTEAVVPIYSFGILSGYMMMGQTLDPSPLNSERARSEAMDVGCDEQELEKLMSQLPVRCEAQIFSCITIMQVCAEYITLTNQLRSGERDLATQAREFLDLNYSTKITLELLCETLYCSRATLTGSFRAAHGCSVGEYLTNVRVKAAQKLLIESSIPLDEVSTRCGFSDRGYFAKVFKRHCGITPAEYREREGKK